MSGEGMVAAACATERMKTPTSVERARELSEANERISAAMMGMVPGSISHSVERHGLLEAHQTWVKVRYGDLRIILAAVDTLTNEAAPAGEVERECDAALAAKDRLLRAVLAAIDTGRSEPLFIVRDQLRNHLGDYANKPSPVFDPAILATAVEAASRMPPEIVRRPLGAAALAPQTTIPAGMKPWHGGDSAPDDAPAATTVKLRGGAIVHGMSNDDLRWAHTGGPEHRKEDIIAYTPKAAPQTTPDAERICRDAAAWERTEAAKPGIGKSATASHLGAAQALDGVADEIAAPQTTPDVGVLVESGRFLLDRLVDHEVRMTSSEDAREWSGHVTPAMARFRAALNPVTNEGEGATARDILSGLSSYVGAGLGDHSTTLEEFDRRIRWGIDHLCSAASTKGTTDG